MEQFISHGIGIATLNKDDLAPDFTGSEAFGVKSLYLYLETVKGVDARRVVIHGVSRLVKTALWAGAADERFAMGIASCSGEGGAAIARRNYGEPLAHMAAPTRYPYQYRQHCGTLSAVRVSPLARATCPPRRCVKRRSRPFAAQSIEA